MMICVLIAVGCLSKQCPTGSECRICEETKQAYCEYSCAFNNGGCPEDTQCSEVAVPTCNPGQCCSQFNITCSGNCITNVLFNGN